jgi:hypothetical protein
MVEVVLRCQLGQRVFEAHMGSAQLINLRSSIFSHRGVHAGYIALITSPQCLPHFDAI